MTGDAEIIPAETRFPTWQDENLLHLPSAGPGSAWGRLPAVPAVIRREGENASHRFLEFFTATIRNPNTRAAYGQAISQFSAWCECLLLSLRQLTPLHVGAYVEQLGTRLGKPSVKQHLAALKSLFDFLVTGQVLPTNPFHSVRGPKYVVKKGKTPVLSGEEARKLLATIDTRTIAGLRDRALLGVMIYSFARISAVLGMNVSDFYEQGWRRTIRLHEKGGKHHEVPAHHLVVEHLGAYLEVAGVGGRKGTPLFRTLGRKRELTEQRLGRREALAMIKRRAKAAGLGDRICCHTFRATGITVYLENGGTVEKAQAIAAHESPRTTKLYDRTSDQLSLDEVEKIVL